MKKFLIILAIIVFTTTSYCSAKSYYTPQVSNGIRMYKAKNYTECLQVMYDAVNKDPSNVVGYYYIAIAQARLGNTSKATEAYQRVIDLNTSTQLTKYAMNGIECLNDPSKCQSGNSYAFVQKSSASVEKELTDRRIDSIKNTVNSKHNIQDVPVEYLRNLKDYSKPQNQIQNKTSEVPTKEEIADALDTLKRAGYQSYLPQPVINNDAMQQLSMINSLNSNNNTDTMSAMMPYMINNARATGKNVDPEVIKTMMMSSMMNGLYGDFNQK